MNLTDDDCIGTTPEVGDQDDDFIYIQDQGTGILTNFDIFDGAGDVRTLTYSVDNGSTSIALSAGSPGIKTIDCNTPCTVDWNHGGSSGSFTYHFSGGSGTFSTGDTTPPTVTSIARQTPATSPTSADTLVFRVVFSENVNNVDATDFTASGTTGTPTGVSGSGDTYDVTVSGGDLAGYNGTVGLGLAGGQNIQDDAANALVDTSPASNQTYTVDNAAPTVTSIVRQTPASSSTSADSLVFRVTFSETVVNVDVTDFTASGTSGTPTGVSGSGDTYDVTVSGGDLAGFNGTVGLGFAGGQNIQDALANALSNTTPTGANETYTVDNTAPTVDSIVRQTPATSPTNADSLVFRVTFSEDVVNVGTVDFTVSGTTATVTGVSGTGDTYDVTISGGSLAGLNDTVSLGFAGAQDIADPVGNALSNTTPTGAYESFTVDNTAPTVTSIARQTPSSSPTGSDTLVFQVVFSEDVANVDAADFTASGTSGTPTGISGSGDTYSVTVSGGDLAGYNGVVGIGFAGGQDIDDLAGNALTNTAPSSNQTYTVDNSGPTVTSIARQSPVTSPTNADSLVFRVTFSEAVQNAGTDDFAPNSTSTATVTNVSPVSTSVYDVTVSGGDLADFNGTVGLGFAGGQDIEDTLANALTNTTPSSNQTYTVDNTEPEISVAETGLGQGAVTDGGTLAQGTQSEGTPVTLTFTVTNSGTADLTIATATSSSLTNVTVNSISAPSDSTVTAGGGTETFTVQYTPTASGAFSFDLSFTNDDSDENPFNFTVSGSTIGVPTGLAAQSGGGQSTEVSTAFGNVLEALVTDTNSVGVPGELVTFTAPASGPSLAFASTGTNTETVLTDANGVATSSALTANAEASPFTGGAYTPYDVTASIAGPFTATFSMTNTRDSAADIAQTQDVIASFVTNRADRIVSSQPNLVNRLSGGPFSQPNNANVSVGPNSQSFDLQVSLRAYAEQRRQDAAALPPTAAAEDPFAAFDLFDTGEATHALGYSASDPAMSAESMPYEPDPSGFDVWLEGSFAMVENKDNDSLTGIIYGGADYRFGDQALLGIMGEADISAESNAVTDTSASGTGWMLGPYAVVRLGDNLYLDGRATYGRSYNQIDPVGLYTDEFTTERLLVQAGITGDFEVGDFVFAPFVRGTYYWERQNAYVDSLSNTIPSQDFDLGRVEFGPHISTVIPMQNYDMALGVGLTGIYDFDKLVDAPPSNPNLASSDHDLRGKLSVDTEIRLPNSNAQIKGEGFYDGIGTGDYLAYGGNLSLLVPF